MHRPYTPNCTGKDLTNFKLRERKRELVKGGFFSAIATNMPIYLVQKLRVIDMIALRYRNTEPRGNTYTVTPPKVMNNLSLHLSLSRIYGTVILSVAMPQILCKLYRGYRNWVRLARVYTILSHSLVYPKDRVT